MENYKNNSTKKRVLGGFAIQKKWKQIEWGSPSKNPYIEIVKKDKYYCSKNSQQTDGHKIYRLDPYKF